VLGRLVRAPQRGVNCPDAPSCAARRDELEGLGEGEGEEEEDPDPVIAALIRRDKGFTYGGDAEGDLDDNALDGVGRQ
jgi:hypothetical protein